MHSSNHPPRRPLLHSWAPAALAALCLLAPAKSRAGAFVPGNSLDATVGTGPRAIATGDLNGDGRPDMIVGNEGSSGVSVLLSQAGGGFAPAVLYNTGPVPGEVVIADFDGDGKLDFAVGHYNTNTVVIMRGTGTGTFTTGATLTGPPHPEGLCAADLNGDGMLDLAACGYASTSTGTASVWLNTGTPGGALSFGARSDYAVGAWPNSIRAGSLVPGQTWLVTANYNGASISLLPPDGTGHFSARTDLPAAPHVYMAAVGNLFLDDPRAQIVTANADSSSISIYRWNTTTSNWARSNYPTPSRPSYVAIADADGDGLLDLVTSNYVAGQLAVFTNTTTADTFTTRVDVPTVTNPYAVAVADFDGDGRPDLVASDRTGSTVRVTYGKASVGWRLGDTLPAFTAKNQNGDSTRVAPGSGRWLLLDMCSSWCGPCQQMATRTEAAYAALTTVANLPFEYVTMLVDGPTAGVPSTLADAQNWARTYSINRPVLHADGASNGGTRAVALASGLIGTPTLRLVDPSGVVRWVHVGSVADTTLARTVAQFAGVPVPAIGQRHLLRAKFHAATMTMRYGVQSISCLVDTSLAGAGLFFFAQPTGTTGSGFGSEAIASRDQYNSLENWEVQFNAGGATPSPMPTTQPWRFTLSNMILDPSTRTLVPGTKAAVSVLSAAHSYVKTTLAVPITWDGSTLTIGDISPDSLKSYAPYYGFDIAFDMQTPGLVADASPAAPVAFALHAPMPNPARQESRLIWTQPRAAEMNVAVFDLSGRLVRTLVRGHQAAGEHAVTWDLTDANGARVRPGLYFARASAAGTASRTARVCVVE